MPERDFGYFLSQRGMFSYTGLSPRQVDRLREEFAVYLVRSGRMCVAGLNRGNVDATARGDGGRARRLRRCVSARASLRSGAAASRRKAGCATLAKRSPRTTRGAGKGARAAARSAGAGRSSRR